MDLQTAWGIFDNEGIEGLVYTDPEEVEDEELAELIREANEAWPAIQDLIDYLVEKSDELWAEEDE